MDGSKLLKTVAFYALVVVIVIFSVFPFYYAIVTSFSTGTALFQINYFPPKFDWSNYQSVLGANFLGNLLTIAVAIGCAALAFLVFGTSIFRALAQIGVKGATLAYLTLGGLVILAVAGVIWGPLDFVMGQMGETTGSRAFGRSIVNSIFIASTTVGFALLLAVTASYALARVQFRGRALLLMTILGVSMFPQIAVLAGLFELMRFLDILNTPWALILSYTIFTLPFTVWVLTTFMRDLPVEIEEAAIVDGATPWVIITQVFMPLMWPALVTTGLLAFIGAWNEFLFALTFTQTEVQRTTPVAIAMLSGASVQEIPWGPIMAASVVVTVPLVVLVLVFQRKIVAGLTAGGVKG